MKFQVRSPKKKMKNFTFNTSHISIGREKSNDIEISDESVSTHHFEIIKRDNIYILRDLSSKNGTYLNGKRVYNTTISNGDKIFIGSTEIIVSLPVILNFRPYNDIIFSRETSNIFHQSNNNVSINKTLDPDRKNQIISYSHMQIYNQFNPSYLLIKKIQSMINSAQTVNKLNDFITFLEDNLTGICSIAERYCFLFRHKDTIQYCKPISVKADTLKMTMLEDLFNEAIASNKITYLNKDNGNINFDNKNYLLIPILVSNNPIAYLYIENESNKKIKLNDIGKVLFYTDMMSHRLNNFILENKIEDVSLGLIESLVATIEAKDTYTVGHSERVSQYCMAIAKILKIDDKTKNYLLISALCHDIGKIGVPDSILKKASHLEREEYEEMKLHPLIGAKIISLIPNSEKILSGVKYHHEKWDGTGYPEGLTGEEIPFFARIIAVADAFDAMVSGRSYSGFMDESDAIEKIKKESDLFDPEILKSLIHAWEEGLLTQRNDTIGNI